MKNLKKSRLLAAGLAFVFLAGLNNVETAGQDKPKEKQKNKTDKSGTSGGQTNRTKLRPGGNGAQPAGPGGTGSQPGGTGSRTGGTGSQPGGTSSRIGGTGSQPGGTSSRTGGTGSQPGGTSSRIGGTGSQTGGTGAKSGGAGTHPGGNNPGGGKSGVTTTTTADGAKHDTHHNSNGIPERSVITHANGAVETEHYGADGKTVKQRVVKNPDQSKETTHFSEKGLPDRSVKTRGDGTEETRHYGTDGKTVKQEVIKKGGMEQTKTYASDGKTVRQAVSKKDGMEQTSHFTPGGRLDKETVKKSDGTTQATTYDLGRREKKVEVVHKDGIKESTDVHYNRDGNVRSRETIKSDANGRPVSKTVVVNQTINNNNSTVVNNNNSTVVKNYYPCRYGYVYAPVVVAPAFYVGWYDPYWYSPAGVVITTHSFTFSWGWNAYPWYGYNAYYWQPYPVYPAPSYWVTDWVVAGYVADRYAVSANAAQTREEVRLAREDAERARLAAERAEDAAEKAEARAAQAAADERVAKAEARAVKAEAEAANRKELAGKSPSNATPIDKATKDSLNKQVEETIAEKKKFAEQSANGSKPIPPDVSTALADPEHIYPVSKNISVSRAKDGDPAGTLTAGDLLKLEPGQEIAKNAGENTFVAMRVMTSKGEDDSVPAGTLIKVPLRELQEFDNEFRAKVDLGLAEADKNKEQFKKGVQQ